MRGFRHDIALGILLCGLAVTPSCGTFPNLSAIDGRPTVQEGELTLHDGQDAIVRFKKVFAAPPRLTIVEFRQSWFKDKPYSRTDFEILAVDAASFRMVNNHPEAKRGSAATIKWRAEGVIAAVQPAPPPLGLAPLAQKSKPTQDDLVEAIRRMGGTAGYDMAVPVPPRPISTVDLHHSKVNDADLEQLRIMAPRLRSLTLSGTDITDAGMQSIGKMPMMQTLLLNETRVSDAGLQQVQRLTEMRQLSLYHTHVTDEGLVYLKGLSNLNELTLSGAHITDHGVMQLTGLRNLRHLTLSQTGVTKTGIQELKKALPKLEIVQ
jgi:hypothetical protein